MADPKQPSAADIIRRTEKRSKAFQRFRMFVFLPGMMLGGLSVLASLVWPPVHAVETAPSRHYDDLRPQVVHSTPAEVVDILEKLVNAEDETTYRIAEPSEVFDGEARIHVQSDRMLPFFDTTTIVTAKAGEDATTIHMRSTSLRGGGKTDFGMNARAIRDLQKMLRDHYTND